MRSSGTKKMGNKKRVMSIWLVVLFGVFLGIGLYLGVPDQSSNAVTDDEAKAFYGAYMKDMNEYGLKDPERLMDGYFSKSLKASVNVANVKSDFGSMVETGVRYGGKVVSTDRTRGDGQVEVAVSEWKESKGKNVDESTVFLGVYVVGREDGKLVFSSIAANDVTDVEAEVKKN